MKKILLTIFTLSLITACGSDTSNSSDQKADTKSEDNKELLNQVKQPIDEAKKMKQKLEEARKKQMEALKKQTEKDNDSEK